jgi:hypothetical protein
MLRVDAKNIGMVLANWDDAPSGKEISLTALGHDETGFEKYRVALDRF